MDELLRKVKKELETIGDKGLTSSNLDTTYKLIDIYKDIKEAEYYECKTEEGTYDAKRGGSRYMGDHDKWGSKSYDRYYPLDDRYDRYLTRMREGLYNYSEGRDRYRDGDSKERMLDGVEMAMGALVNFVEFMMDNVETTHEKDVIRKYIDKLKKV